MSIAVFVQELAQRGVELFVDDGRLCYRAAAGALTDELLAEISAQRAALISHLQNNPGSTGSYPLSHGQAALWFLYEIDRDSLAYNIALAARLVCDLDLLALRAALDALHARHPILCSRFAAQSGAPSQDFDGAKPSFDVVDASGWSHDEVERSVAAFADKPFDLENGPVARWRVLTAAANAAGPTPLLVFAAHHAIIDFRSLEILFKDLGRFHHAQLAGRSAELPALPWTYRDYVRWSRNWPQSPLGQAARAYWLAQLGALPPALDLPSDRPRPARQQYEGAQLLSTLPAELTSALRDFARHHLATPNMVLLSTFGLMLHRYSSCDDLLVGTPMLGRNRDELRNLVGYFVNTVAVRLRFPAGLDGRGLVAQTRQTFLDALAHQDYPFPLLVEELRPERDPSRSPLVQVMFVYERESGDDLESQGLVTEVLLGGQRGAAFDLTLTALDRGDAIRLTWDFATALFDVATIRRMAGHFTELLRGLLAMPGAAVGSLPMISAEERRTLAEWNTTSRDYPRERSIPDVFAARAAESPDAIAVAWGPVQLSYGALAERADRLAGRLCEQDLQPEAIVAIMVDRSPAMIVAMLAILKAGGAYLPIGPDLPPDRIRYMLDESEAPVLIAGPRQASLIRKLQAACASLRTVLTLDPEGREPTGGEPVRLTGIDRSAPDALSYVMYTSGTSGRPKGVMVEHRAILRLVLNTNFIQLGPSDCILQTGAFSFDAATFEVWGALLNGGRLCLPETDEWLGAHAFAALVQDHGATTVWLTASVFNALAAEDAMAFAGLRTVLCGGERLSVHHVNLVRSANPGLRLINGYGPTENTTFTTTFEIRETFAGDIPIGSPIANTTVYILNERLEPVPIGGVGELYAGGDGLARGCLHDLALTAARFVAHPFQPGERLYRTGDLARWRWDGVIEFLGRMDEQVKIRGFRIELGEIEAVLNRHAEVNGAAVIVDGEGDAKRLLAYVAAASPDAALQRRLDAHLRAHFPPYMLPASVTALERLPLTSSGKLDRRALPAPQLAVGDGFTEARSATGSLLAGLWAAVLQLPQVSATANFFALGGHSLAAMRLSARMRDAFGIELPLRSIFERPTIAGLAELIDSRLGTVALPAPAPRPDGAEVVLSFGQQRLWFLGQLEGPSATYNMPATLALRGHLDTAALRRAFERLVERHASLRQCFPSRAGQPCSHLLDPYDPLSVTDLSALPTAERHAEAQRLSRDHAAQPFDLANGPLFRVGLLRLADEAHWLLFNVHHIVSDGWSLGVIVRELDALYQAESHGGDAAVPVLTIQYPDYAAWERDWLQGEVLSDQLAYWRRQLADAPPRLELPTDRPRPARRTYRGGLHEQVLEENLTAAVRRFNAVYGSTVFMTLLATFKLLLWRWSGQSDLSVGTPLANRQHGRTEDLIGFFVNTVVLRSRLDPQAGFDTLLALVRHTCLDAYTHPDLPFDYLVEQLQPERSLSDSPLFQVMFVQQNVWPEDLTLSDLKVERHPPSLVVAKFDLTLYANEQVDRIGLGWEYNADLFDAATIGRMATHFAELLGAALRMPGVALGNLPMIPTADDAELRAWNDTTAPWPAQRTVGALFAAQAARTPSAVAVEFAGGELSYRALDNATSALAYRLQGKGVGPNVPVAVAVQRGVEQIIAVIGVIRAGGACLPLDPEHPAERLTYMLQESEAPLILTTAALAPGLPVTAAETMCFDLIDIRSGTPSPAGLAGPDDLLYVLYTSGSTGRPKGVAVPHRTLVNLIAWQARQPGLDTPARVLQFTPLTFDVAFQEIASTLCGGGTLVLIDEDTRRNSDGLLAVLAARRIERLFLPFVALQHLAESAAPNGAPACLRDVITAGEQLRATPAIRGFFRRARCRLHNHYGPTESHVVTAFRLPKAVDAWNELPPIGAPVANVQVHVLDDAGRRMPIGVPGEICIGGVALAHGYLNRPELNAERFCDHPDLGRLYRSGDLAKWRPDGMLIYLGRRDRQIKLRGFRIELGEIEAVLCRHAEVSEAAVIVDGEGDANRLLAYVAARSREPAGLQRILDAHLRAHLPPYMLPAGVTVLDHLPQTSSGKLDHRALPAPQLVAGAKGSSAPSGAIETLVAELWAGMLGLARVDRDANFFEVGGHSLLATRLTARILDRCGVELPLATLFMNPTIAGLAAAIEAEQGLRLPPLSPQPSEAELVLSSSQQRLWFIDQLEGPSTAYSMPAAFELRGELDESALRRALVRLVHRHAILRSCFPSRDGEPCLRLLPHYDPLAFTDLSSDLAANREAERLRAADAAEPFRLATGPLLRFHLIRLEPQRYWLLFNMHHIISDGWSIDLIIREVRVFYAACRSGRTPDLPALPIQYTDYAIWERRRLDCETLRRRLDYWRATLAGAPEKLELPADFPRPAMQRHASGEVSLTLNSTLVQRLTSLAQSAHGTLFMALLVAFAAVLARASGQRDMCIGAPVANRNQPQLADMIGLFLNTLVLRVRITPGASFRELLATVRETALSAYANQDVPFEYLVEKLQPQRSLSHHPLFQVMLNLVNTQSEEFVLDGLDVQLLDRTEGRLAKFDMNLALMPQPDGSLVGRLEFNAELFVTETIAFLAERLVTLVGQVVAHPDAPLADLSLLDADWRTRTISAPRLCPTMPALKFGGVEQSIAARFAEQVRRNGNRIAVRTTERVLTYDALDQATRRVAAAILATPSGRHVALLLPHDAGMVVGVIGVLQAGRAYVPLDPLQPHERLAGIVADAQASGIVCTAALRNLAIEITGGSLPVFDVDDPGTTAALDLPSVAPDHNAYLIYTSGSTGRPKGVIQSHRNVLHFTRQYAEALRISPEDRLLQVASYAFDAGVMDTFGALLNGACLHPVDFRQVGPEGCCTRLAAEGLTILHVTPTVFRLLARSMRHPLPAVRLVVLGGERVTRSDALLFRERFTPGCLLVNGFGPTESTVTLQHFVDHATPLPRASLPVGYPVADTDILLLDPDGAVAELYGEIAVRSAHVALGYWRQPSAAFSDDPERPGKRRYRTGDLGRLLPDGSLEVVGRVDQQIKLRGFRIEPGEIEAVLRQHPSVREAAVALHPADADAVGAEQRLVAYVASEAGSRELRAYLRQKLPDYLVPASVTVLAALPLTANGKLDRARLPAQEDDGPDATQAPATPTEELLAGIWCEVLGRGSVDREDNFFDLGGHSLLAMQLVARIRESVAVELPLRVLFEHPVVRDLAAAVDAAQRGTPLPPLVPCAQGPELPLSFAQQRL